jgi:hypothetical protein
MVIFLSGMVIFLCVVCIVAASPCASHQKVTPLLLLDATLKSDAIRCLTIRADR